MNTSTPATQKCLFCKVNEASYDGESHGYFSWCYPCFELNHTLAPHLHDHTAHRTVAVFVGGVLVARKCTKHDCGETFPLEHAPGIRVTAYHTVRPTTQDTVRTLGY